MFEESKVILNKEDFEKRLSTGYYQWKLQQRNIAYERKLEQEEGNKNKSK